jgi:hypothetical protein
LQRCPLHHLSVASLNLVGYIFLDEGYGLQVQCGLVGALLDGGLNLFCCPVFTTINRSSFFPFA